LVAEGATVTHSVQNSILRSTTEHNVIMYIDREFVTSAKKFENFNAFSEIKKIVKIRTKIRYMPECRTAAGTRVPVGYPGNKLYPGNCLLPDGYPGSEYLICRIYLIGFSELVQ